MKNFQNGLIVGLKAGQAGDILHVGCRVTFMLNNEIQYITDVQVGGAVECPPCPESVDPLHWVKWKDSQNNYISFPYVPSEDITLYGEVVDRPEFDGVLLAHYISDTKVDYGGYTRDCRQTDANNDLILKGAPNYNIIEGRGLFGGSILRPIIDGNTEDPYYGKSLSGEILSYRDPDTQKYIYDFTVECWFKFDRDLTYVTSDRVEAFYFLHAYNIYPISPAERQRRGKDYCLYGLLTYTYIDITLNEWHHLSFSYANKDAASPGEYVYLDGTLIASSTSSSNYGTHPRIRGWSSYTRSSPVRVCEYAIYRGRKRTTNFTPERVPYKVTYSSYMGITENDILLASGSLPYGSSCQIRKASGIRSVFGAMRIDNSTKSGVYLISDIQGGEAIQVLRKKYDNTWEDVTSTYAKHTEVIYNGVTYYVSYVYLEGASFLYNTVSFVDKSYNWSDDHQYTEVERIAGMKADAIKILDRFFNNK